VCGKNQVFAGQKRQSDHMRLQRQMHRLVVNNFTQVNILLQNFIGKHVFHNRFVTEFSKGGF